MKIILDQYLNIKVEELEEIRELKAKLIDQMNKFIMSLIAIIEIWTSCDFGLDGIFAFILFLVIYNILIN
jgi:hypothetical protein